MLSFFWLLFVPFLHARNVTDSCLGVDCLNGFVCDEGDCRPPLPITPPANVPATPITGTNVPNACASNPCVNECECIESCMHEDGYYCKSSNGFMGKNCDVALPQLDCSPDKITISVTAALFKELFPSEAFGCLYIGENVGEPENENGDCRACFTEDNLYSVSLSPPFTQCGGTSNTTNEKFSFQNLVWAGLNHSDVYDVPVPVLNFECSYSYEYTVVTSLEPKIENYRGYQEGKLKLPANIELCKIGNACPNACPEEYSLKPGAKYTISQTVHTIMSVPHTYPIDAGNSLVLENMYLSCNDVYSDVLAPEDVSLARGGCRASALSNINRQRSTESVLCVSFKLPRLKNCSNSMLYVHAKLKMADALPQCRRNTAPIKRSVSDDEPENTALIFIPFRIIQDSDGSSDTIELFPNVNPKRNLIPKTTTEPYFPSDEAYEKNHGLLIGGLIFGCLILCVIVLATYYLRI